MSKELWIKENLKSGEIYAGIILGAEGAPDHHLILLPGEAESVKWAAAKKWASSVGGELPSRSEQSLLFANLKAQFQPRYYWSAEQHASGSGFAWNQGFDVGYQGYGNTSSEWRARAVRRLVIQ